MELSRPRRLIVAAVAVVLLAGGCGDDDDDVGDEAADATTTTSEPDGGSVEGIEVTAVDYEFEGLPDGVEAGTKLSLTNSSEKELHELVAFALPRDEDREVDELMKLPQDQLEALFAGPPATVLVAPPGGEPQIEAVGDGTLAEPGRYLVMCTIPTGADPAEFLAAMQKAQGGPPEGVAGGPPHFTQGMYGEVLVE